MFDVDSKRMMIRVEQGKGRKCRVAGRSQQMIGCSNANAIYRLNSGPSRFSRALQGNGSDFLNLSVTFGRRLVISRSAAHRDNAAPSAMVAVVSIGCPKTREAPRTALHPVYHRLLANPEVCASERPVSESGLRRRGLRPSRPFAKRAGRLPGAAQCRRRRQ